METINMQLNEMTLISSNKTIKNSKKCWLKNTNTKQTFQNYNMKLNTNRKN